MIMMKRVLLGLTVLFAAITLAACQEEPVDELIISESSVTLDEGESYQLSFTSSFRDDHLTWVSSGIDLLTVANGRLNALEAGNVTVTVYARNGQIFDQVNVTIEDVPEPEIVPIEITVNGEGITSDSPVVVSELTTPEQDGATFVGWFTDEALTEAFEASVIESSITLYPKFEVIELPVETVTVTLNDEAGELIKAFDVEKGSLLSALDFPETPDTFVGYFEDASVCGDGPFDLETEVNEALTLIQVLNDDSSPCIALDTVEISGSAVLGETLTISVTPNDAEVSISWTADGEVLGTGPALTIDEALEGLEIDVNVLGVNDYTGTLTASTGLVEAKTYEVDVINEAGDTLTTLNVKAGETIDQSLLPELGDNEMGFYDTAESCDTPFDLDEPIEASQTLYVFTLDNQLPCAELELLTITGDAKVGETLIANVFPRGADVRFEWFVSDNNITYSLIPGVTSAALVVNEDLEGKYIAVNVIGEGTYQGVLKNGTSRVAPKIETLEEQGPSQEEIINAQLLEERRLNALRLISEAGFIPIASADDFSKIGDLNNDENHIFAEGTEFESNPSLNRSSKFILVNDIDYNEQSRTRKDRFDGIVDGNGFTISGLKNSNAFFHDFTGEIRNLTINNSSFKFNPTSLESGIIAEFIPSSATNVTLSNLNINNIELIDFGTINRFGVLIGTSVGEELLISGVSINTTVSSLFMDKVSGYFGGLVGLNDNKTKNISIYRSMVTLNIDETSITDKIGGLIGLTASTNVTESIVNLKINLESNGTSMIGGFFGEIRFDSNSQNTINDSLSIVNIRNGSGNKDRLGGILGEEYTGELFITNTISLNNIDESNDANNNFIIGNDTSVDTTGSGIVFIYWDFVNQINSDSSGMSNQGYQDFSTFFQSTENFTNIGFDIGNDETNVWTLIEGETLPYLSWQEEPLPEQIITQP